MYEYRNGSKRLADALQNNITDTKLKILANLLNYYPRQLEEDIKALNDFVTEHLKTDREEEYD